MNAYSCLLYFFIHIDDESIIIIKIVKMLYSLFFLVVVLSNKAILLSIFQRVAPFYFQRTSEN